MMLHPFCSTMEPLMDSIVLSFFHRISPQWRTSQSSASSNLESWPSNAHRSRTSPAPIWHRCWEHTWCKETSMNPRTLPSVESLILPVWPTATSLTACFCQWVVSLTTMVTSGPGIRTCLPLPSRKTQSLDQATLNDMSRRPFLRWHRSLLLELLHRSGLQEFLHFSFQKRKTTCITRLQHR